MEPSGKKRFWKTCRICFRGFRISVLALILALLCCLLYFNQVGLPEFIKKPVLERLRARGIDLEFTRMRWRWHHGIVAENVRFVRSDGSVSPTFAVREAQVQLDYRALARLDLQVRALVLHEGELSWKISGTNAPAKKLSLNSIETELRLLPGDLWELNRFQAQFAGAQIQLGGVLTNASAVRHWKALRKREPTAPAILENRIRQLAQTLEQIHFATPPELHLDVRGDAMDLQSFTVRLNINTPDADTPWGTLQQAFLSVVLLPASSNVLSHAELNLEAASAQTRWAGATNVNLKLDLLSIFPDTNTVHAELNVSATGIKTRWGSATSANVAAKWIHSMTNAIPISGEGEVRMSRAETQFGEVGHLRFATSFEPSPKEIHPLNPTWSWWTNLAPYALNWNCDANGIQSPKLEVSEFSCAGYWAAPELALSRISGALYGGRLNAEAGIDIGTRLFTFDGSSDFDAQKISPLLTAKSRQWISQFAWIIPPKLKASGSFLLPAWTNFTGADWHGGVRPTIRLDGHFDVGNGSFRGLAFNSARSHFSYSNLFWRLPDLIATRTDGRLQLAHVSNEATRDYHFKIHSTIHPLALKPLLETNQHRIYDIVGFSEPPVIDGEIWGRWYDHASIGARARIAATNFTIRGESFDSAVAALEYTNLFLRVIEPRARRGIEHGSATSLDIDIPARKIYLTNGVGLADPQVITRAVGPKVGKLMEPYRFLKPVAARVNGVIPMRDPRDADLVFEMEGGPFEWWKFKVPTVSGRVHWLGEHLELRGLQAQFYRGTATGDAAFDFQERDAAKFRFDVLANDTDLHLLMTDLSGKANRLEGRLTGRLTITEGTSTNLNSLQGSGRLELRDGLIWDIPIFGILSPVLDGIAPGMGLGSSRAREGSATFTIKDGVARSDDLEIRASMMRLQYWGTVNLENTRLDARAQAELFRDTWVVGRLISLTLWPVSKIFEYRFTGTFQEPKSDPVFFVPKILLIPFHPIRTLKELAPDLPESSGAP
jgi:hypothetical protein